MTEDERNGLVEIVAEGVWLAIIQGVASLFFVGLLAIIVYKVIS